MRREVAAAALTLRAVCVCLWGIDFEAIIFVVVRAVGICLRAQPQPVTVLNNFCHIIKINIYKILTTIGKLYKNSYRVIQLCSI